jgi:hypothetical protein
MILERMSWLGLAGAIALVAAIPFDRFDPAYWPARRRARGAASQSRKDELADPYKAGMADRVAKLLPRTDREDTQQGKTAETSNFLGNPEALSRGRAWTSLTPLATPSQRWRFPAVFAAELKLMLKGQSLLWYAGALALNLACLLNPSEAVQRYLLLMVWVWPVLVWSQMGVRERRYGTDQILFSMPRPALRQLPALWMAGVVVAVVAGTGGWLYLALNGEITSLLAWFVGAFFVPALALALGLKARALMSGRPHAERKDLPALLKRA